MSIEMLKKNCHQVLGSQKTKLRPLELVFETAGAINPPSYKDRVKDLNTWEDLKTIADLKTIRDLVSYFVQDLVS